MKTWQDLLNTGKPFIAIKSLIYVIYYPNKEEVYWEQYNYDNSLIDSGTTHLDEFYKGKISSWALVDWFEERTIKTWGDLYELNVPFVISCRDIQVAYYPIGDGTYWAETTVPHYYKEEIVEYSKVEAFRNTLLSSDYQIDYFKSEISEVIFKLCTCPTSNFTFNPIGCQCGGK